MASDEAEFRRQFEGVGFLAPLMPAVAASYRTRNKSWFDLIDDVASALQKTSMRNADAACLGFTLYEQKSMAHAVLLRSAGTLQGTIIMSERGMVIEARTLARSVTENAFCMAALHDDPTGFLEHLKADDAAARRGQITAILKNGVPKGMSEERLRAFLAEMPKQKNLGMIGVAEMGSLARQYLAYRVLSNDGAHPSATSLMRHIAVNADRTEWTGFKIGPAKDRDVLEALNLTALAALPIGVAYTQIMGDGAGNAEFAELADRYQSLPDTRGN